MTRRSRHSTAMIKVNYDSKEDFLEISRSCDLSSIETLKMICKFFKDNYDYVTQTKGEFKSTLRGETNDKTKTIWH